MEFNFYGITSNILDELSYESKLGKSLKNTLRKFNKDDIFKEIRNISRYLNSRKIDFKFPVSYRIKSYHSCLIKYDKYYPNMELNKCFNDLLGIRIIVDSYYELFEQDLSSFRLADMRTGKANDDGYRGVHLYYQKSNFHYPIELQINTKVDRQINDLLHMYIYKHTKNNLIGKEVRGLFDEGNFKNIQEFKGVIEDVLRNSEEI
ncbi:hypothetical protein ACPMCT_17095 [Clostridioides difficile]|uniref:RelA/SpoT family protein n=1 Tax=Clostridioides difficile TaxID=1496 RepID=UPI00038C9D95|nr:RelA/SpoT family protein [Clostridioides difficile]EQJ94826.1 RelA/SpoT family protein [Clostridioides difficile P49]MBY1861101.1 hypothetical protein [Clostridioides difficile]MBZ0706828.1 hypothetical protein [Clostridioides difficile]MCH7327217.1 hypothetical protein [Clostridioides difficile]MCI4737369.1 hypothetical protein [Clostridioides difficile]